MNLNSTQQFQEALQVVISRLNADLREASGKLEHLPACEWQSQHGRALLNREQELHTAWCALNGMRSTQAEPVAVASPTMEQKIAGAHAADIKPSQAEAVYLAMLATTSETAVPVIDTCDEGGHRFAKLPNHPMRDGRPRCPHCMAVGLDRARYGMQADAQQITRGAA